MKALTIRRAVFGLTLTICLGCWLLMFGSLVLFGHPGIARWTAMVTVSTVATEITFWVGAFTLSWSIFAKRRRFWQRMVARITGRPEQTLEGETK